MDFENEIPSPKTPVTPIINFENNEDVECEEVCIIGVNGRKLTSAVWKYFTQVQVGKEIKAKCSGCKKLFTIGGKNGTTHLKDHLKRCLKVKNYVDVKQQLLKPTMKDSPNTLGIGSKNKFNQQYSRNALVSMIVNHEYPLAMVDHIGFKRYSNSLNPYFKVILRNTVKADIFREYNEERRLLEKVLARNKSRIAFTSDMWTCTNQRKGYMAVTTHYIDDDWILQNQLIRYLSFTLIK